MKILLFGPNGQVGWELQRALSPLGEVLTLGRDAKNGITGDLSKLDRLAHAVRVLAPDVIVNAAAYTAVDRAEEEPRTAAIVNTDAPGLLAEEARAIKAWLVHYSTDYVFDGSGDHRWKETDAPNPLNVYGATKLGGERAIQQSGCRFLILRTSWVYAARGHNFLRTMLRLAGEERKARVVSDQIGTPTGAELIADVTAQVLAVARRNPELGGLYHVAPTGEASWYDYAKHVLVRARKEGWPIPAIDDTLEPVSSGAYVTVAQRPRNSRLDCSLLVNTFDLHLPQWQTGVDRTLKELRAGDFCRGTEK